MIFVFNATPLIHIARAGLAWTLRQLEGEKLTVPSVYREVVEAGKAKGFGDALATESLVSEDILVIKHPPGELVRVMASHKDIHEGEAEVIALAKDLGAIAFIDDPIAREISRIHGVETEGSFGMILRMLRAEKITKEEARSALRRLVESGWRCDIELYERLLGAVDEF